MDTNNNYANPEMEEQDIDWVGIASKMWLKRKFVIICVFIAGILGVAYAIRVPKMYEASITIAPELANNSRSTSGLGGLASSLGISLATNMQSGDALNVALFPEMASSTPFLTELFDVPVVPYVSPKQLKDGVEPMPETTLYRFILNKDKQPGLMAKLKASIFGDPKNDTVINENREPYELSREEYIAISILKKMIAVDVEKKTGVTTIGITSTDPRLCVQLADTVCARLQRTIHKYRTEKASQNVEYYTMLADEAREKMIAAQAEYDRSVDYDRSVILHTVASEKERLQGEANLAQQIYQQMVQQREAAKAKYQEMKPVFVVVQPATMPILPKGPRRAVIVLGFLFAGFAGAAAWIFGSHYVFDFIAEIKKRPLEELEAEKKEA